jgi:hypothetical protein
MANQPYCPACTLPYPDFDSVETQFANLSKLGSGSINSQLKIKLKVI